MRVALAACPAIFDAAAAEGHLVLAQPDPEPTLKRAVQSNYPVIIGEQARSVVAGLRVRFRVE